MKLKWISIALGCGLVVLAVGSFAAFWVVRALKSASDDGLAMPGSAPSTASSNAAIARFETEFRATCTHTCTQNHASMGACTEYCSCQIAELQRGLTREQSAQLLSHGTQFGGMSVELQERIAANMGTCGATVHDEQFHFQCLQSCTGAGTTDAACSTYCACALTHLRAGMSRSEGTLWMTRNTDVTPPTREGEDRMRAAITACRPGSAGK